MSKRIVGGIEGGGTCSNVTLIDVESSKVLCTVYSDLPTNLYHIGIDETCNRCQNIVKEALAKIGADPGTKLEALGLSLSGCEVAETMEELRKRLMELHPDLTQECVVASDTVGTLLTASGNGGMVLISGTGSNSLLQNPGEEKTERCGGWGHMIGDEGSAFKVSHRAVKMMFDQEDNLGPPPPHDVTRVKAAILDYFHVKDRFGMLAHFYDTFSKPKFAGLCAKIANEAANGDKLSLYLMEENGRELARHILALVPKMAPSLLVDLHVVCVGSVWKSWNLMQGGFHDELKGNKVKQITLVKLKVPMSVGACYMAATKSEIQLKTTYDENCQVFCHEKY